MNCGGRAPRLLGALLAILLLGAAPLVGTTPLERAISFDNARGCDWSAQFEAIIRRLSHFDASSKSVRAGAEFDVEGFGRVVPRIERIGQGWFRIAAATRGDWHGLSLLSIELESGIESGPFNVGLVFSDPPEAARARLNRLGFDLPMVGQSRLTETEVIEAGLRLERRDRGSVLWCFAD